MTRSDKAKEFFKREHSTLSNLKTISHIGMTALHIPGAKKRLHRHLIDRAGNTGLSISSMLAARKIGMSEDKAIAISKAGVGVAKDLGAPSLGKIIIRK